MPTGEHARTTDAMARGGFLIQAKGLTRIAELKRKNPQVADKIPADATAQILRSPQTQEPEPSPERQELQETHDGAEDSTAISASAPNYVNRFKTWAYSHKIVVAIVVLVVALTAITVLLNQLFDVWKSLTR